MQGVIKTRFWGGSIREMGQVVNHRNVAPGSWGEFYSPMKFSNLGYLGYEMNFNNPMQAFGCNQIRHKDAEFSDKYFVIVFLCEFCGLA